MTEQDASNTTTTPKVHTEDDLAYLWAQELETASQLKHAHETKDLSAERKYLQDLSDIYISRYKISNNLSDLRDAAALCNAALVRDSLSEGCDKEHLHETLANIEKFMIASIVGKDISDIPDNSINCTSQTIANKSMLQSTRDIAKRRCIRQMEKVWNVPENEQEDHRLEREEEFVRWTKILFTGIARRTRQFISKLVDQCINVIGPPPCKYALLGLGSLAREETTPYSDIEFAILVEDSQDGVKKYFQNLVHYLHLKVINLGETHLPAMAIKSLNDFSEGGDNWFYDDITPSGFKFDGAMPWASKIPVVKEAADSRPLFDLIGTPEELASYQQYDISVQQGYHLADILTTVTRICGEQSLLEKYMQLADSYLTESCQGPVLDVEHSESDKTKFYPHFIQSIWSNICEESQVNVERQVREWTVGSLRFASSMMEDYTKKGVLLIPIKELASNMSLKQEMYRLPSAILNNIRLLLVGLKKANMNTWDFIDESVQSNDKKHSLKVMLSVVVMLRLTLYSTRGKQSENLSLLQELRSTTSPQQQKLFEYSTHAIVRMSQTLIPLLETFDPDRSAGHQSENFFNGSELLEAFLWCSLERLDCGFQIGKQFIENLPGHEEGLTEFDCDVAVGLADYFSNNQYHKECLALCETVMKDESLLTERQKANKYYYIARSHFGSSEYEMAGTFYKKSVDACSASMSNIGGNKDFSAISLMALNLSQLAEVFVQQKNLVLAIPYLFQAHNHIGHYIDACCAYFGIPLLVKKMPDTLGTQDLREISLKLVKDLMEWKHDLERFAATIYHQKIPRSVRCLTLFCLHTISKTLAEIVIFVSKDYQTALQFLDLCSDLLDKYHGANTPHWNKYVVFDFRSKIYSAMGDYINKIYWRAMADSIASKVDVPGQIMKE